MVRELKIVNGETLNDNASEPIENSKLDVEKVNLTLTSSCGTSTVKEIFESTHHLHSHTPDTPI